MITGIFEFLKETVGLVRDGLKYFVDPTNVAGRKKQSAKDGWDEFEEKARKHLQRFPPPDDDGLR